MCGSGNTVDDPNRTAESRKKHFTQHIILFFSHTLDTIQKGPGSQNSAKQK